MARKVAIILRGPPGAGKTTVANALQDHFHLARNSHVVLDRFWGKGEKRFAGFCRYWDLRDQSDVLIIELGYGEPVDESFPGATKNPREWISILESDGREVFFFLLQIAQSETVRRVSTRNDLTPDYAKAAHDRYNQGAVCCSATFSALIGTSHSEETINTEEKDLAATVTRIVTKIGST